MNSSVWLRFLRGGFVLSSCLSALAASAATSTPLSNIEDPLIWGTSANEPAFNCAISGSGLVVGFESAAVNLVAGDRNGRSDAFVGAAGVLQRISGRVGGSEGRRNAVRVDLSNTGRYAAFLSADDLLETGGGVEQPNTVFHRDLQTGTLLRAATTLSGTAATVSDGPRVSGNGRYVLFVSADANLVAGDSNSTSDVFRFDTQTGTLLRVSTKLGGGQMSNNVSGLAAIDNSGDLIAFAATDGDLIAGDNNGFVDVFVKRISSGAVVRASQSAAGIAADRDARNPEVSSNGAFVIFESGATNLVAGDGNNRTDIFRYEIASATLLRASIGSAGQESSSDSNAAGVTAAGRYVFFDTVGINIGGSGTAQQLFVRDFDTSTTTRLTTTMFGVFRSRISDAGDAACIVTADALDLADGNWQRDVYRLDLTSAASSRISVANAVVPVGYGSGRTNIMDVSRDATRAIAVSRAVDLDADSFNELGALVRSNGGAEPQLPEFVPSTGAIRLLGRAANGSLPQPSGIIAARLSADGAVVAFTTSATNLDARASGVNVYRQTLPNGVPTLVSLGIDNLGAGGSAAPVADGSGARVAFQSTASNLVAGDTNGASDVFVWDSVSGIRRVSVSSSGAQATASSDAPDISDNGQWIAFSSAANNLVTGDSNSAIDIFVHDRVSGVTERVSLDSAGMQRPSPSTQAAISPDGRFVAYLYNGSGNERGIYLYDRTALATRLIGLPSGTVVNTLGARFGRDGRYLSLIANDAGSSIAYRYDVFAASLRELLRTSSNIYATDNAPHDIVAVRVASSTMAVLSTDQPLGEFDRNNDFDLMLVTLNPGVLSLTSTTLNVSEGAGTLLIPVVRSGGAEGAVGVGASVVPISASSNDFNTPGTFATFADNQTTPANFEFEIVDDALIEGNETLTLQIVQPSGGATVGSPDQMTITIIDNDSPDSMFANGFE